MTSVHSSDSQVRLQSSSPVKDRQSGGRGGMKRLLRAPDSASTGALRTEKKATEGPFVSRHDFGQDADPADSAGLFLDNNLGADPLLEHVDVRDDPDGLVILPETLHGGDGDLEGLRVQAAKALVDEQRIDPNRSAGELRKAQGKCEAHQEALAALVTRDSMIGITEALSP